MTILNIAIERERTLLVGMWQFIGILFLISLVGLLLSGCYSADSTRKANASNQYGNALTLKEALCRHVAVRCMADRVTVRGEDPVWYLDGMKAHSTLISHVNVNDVAVIDVCTRASCLNMYPDIGRRYVIHIYTK